MKALLLLLLAHNSGGKKWSGNKHNKTPLPAIFKLTKASTNEVVWHFEKDRFFPEMEKICYFFSFDSESIVREKEIVFQKANF